MKKKFCKGILALTFTFLCLKIPAQQALKIGDTLPESFWTTPLQVVNHPEKTITLDKDRGKLILLDFWNTWCSACLLSLPKIMTLQKQFGDRLKIIPVTDQKRSEVEKFMESRNGQRFSDLQSVIGDQLLKTMIPRLGVPFIAWVKDGKLLNTTDAEQVNGENISKIFSGDATTLQTVIQMDRSRPLFLSDAYDRQKNTSLLNYSVFIKGSVPDIGSGGTYRYGADKKVHGRQFTNLSLADIYYAIAYQLFQAAEEKENFSRKRMITEINNRAELEGVVHEDGTLDEKYLYSYELIVPAHRADSLYSDMLRDLNRYSPYSVTVEKRAVKCLVLKRTSAKDRLASKGGEPLSTFPRSPSELRNMPLKVMVNMLNGNTAIELPVVDETAYTGRVDLKVSGVSSLSQLKKELAAYGLDLEESVRHLNMLIVKNR